MRRVGFAAALLWLAGCSCEDPPPTSISLAQEVGEGRGEGSVALPTATRTDLPEPTPALVITVTPDAWHVSNAALVASWPDRERQAVARTRPLGDAEYPVRERDAGDARELRTALAEIAALERTRVSITHEGAPSRAFAIRADADTGFDRVLAAIEAAGAAGLDGARLVVASTAGERELRLTLPGPDDAPPDPAIGAALAGALAAIDGTGGPAHVDVGAAEARSVTAALLDETGLVIRRGAVRLAPGCTEPAPADATAPTIPTEAITASSLAACLGAAAAPVSFGASSSMRYGDVVGVLEALAVDRDVRISTIR